MARIVNGIIVNDVQPSQENESSGSHIKIFGRIVPIWAVVAFILVSFIIFSVKGGEKVRKFQTFSFILLTKMF